MLECNSTSHYQALLDEPINSLRHIHGSRVTPLRRPGQHGRELGYSNNGHHFQRAVHGHSPGAINAPALGHGPSTLDGAWMGHGWS